jgi:hypothetical protein
VIGFGRAPIAIRDQPGGEARAPMKKSAIFRLNYVSAEPIAICKIVDSFSRKHYHKIFAGKKVAFSLMLWK